MELHQLSKQAPGLVSLAKKAAVSLDKQGLAGHKAAVHLVLDHSGSMHDYYARGDVQRLAEQTLALSVNLDDDGVVPVTYFHSSVEPSVAIAAENYAGAVAGTHVGVPWGSTNYVAAMEAVIAHDRRDRAGGYTGPTLAVFQTDGEPNDRGAVESLLREASVLPIFWAFIGFGPKRNMGFLERLDALAGRRVDNASFFHAEAPSRVSDEELYDAITSEYAEWLTKAREAGVRFE